MTATEFTIDFLHILNPLTAFGGKARREYVHQVAQAVEKYAPRMSDKVGIDLTDIRVQDFRYLARETFAQGMQSSSELEQSPATRILYHILSYGLMRPISGFYAMLLEEDGVLSYSHSNSTIYVPFAPMTKLNLLANKGRFVDEEVVHELSHHLWMKLGGKFERNSQFKQWSEGFAFYGQHTWFANLYPPGYETKYRSEEDNYGEYDIEELVKEHGREILMRIPQEWETFEAKLRSQI